MSEARRRLNERRRRALRIEYPFFFSLFNVGGVPQILKDTFVRDNTAAVSPRTVFQTVLSQKEEKGRKAWDRRRSKRKESSSGAATCRLAFLSRRAGSRLYEESHNGNLRFSLAFLPPPSSRSPSSPASSPSRLTLSSLYLSSPLVAFCVFFSSLPAIFPRSGFWSVPSGRNSSARGVEKN